MIHRPQRLIATSVFMLSLLITAAMTTPAAAQDPGGNDLRDIRVGKLARMFDRGDFAIRMKAKRPSSPPS